MGATLQGHEEMSGALALRPGADPELSGERPERPNRLPRAASYGQGPSVSLCLLHAPTKVNINGANRNGRTPLPLTAGKGHETIVKVIEVTSSKFTSFSPLEPLSLHLLKFVIVSGAIQQ
jgi:hypothetical protein